MLLRGYRCCQHLFMYIILLMYIFWQITRYDHSTDADYSASAGYQDAWQRVSVVSSAYNTLMNWPLGLNSFKGRPGDFHWGWKTKLMLQKMNGKWNPLSRYLSQMKFRWSNKSKLAFVLHLWITSFDTVRITLLLRRHKLRSRHVWWPVRQRTYSKGCRDIIHRRLSSRLAPPTGFFLASLVTNPPYSWNISERLKRRTGKSSRSLRQTDVAC